MRNIFYFFLGFCFISLNFALNAMAANKDSVEHIRNANHTADGIPAIPQRVIVNQQNAQVYAQCMAKVIITDEGEKVLVLPFPKSAENIQLSLPTHQGKSQGEITSWIVEKALPFKPHGSVEKRRITFESMYDSLAGSLMNLRAQQFAMFESLKGKNGTIAIKDAEKLSPNLALVGTRIASVERELALAKQRYEQFQDSLPTRQQLVVRITSPLAENAEALVSYTYTLSNTFWKPVYVINANTKDDTIDVQLLAEISQNSDLDWFDVQLELTTAQGDERDPAPLYPWVVRKATNEAALYARSMAGAPQAMMSNAMAKDSAPIFSQGSAMARWTLNKLPKLPEGQTVIKLSQEKWNVPLLRIARPAASANKVWLSATHKIDSSYYPTGEASYLLDGVTTGKGIFAPKAGEAQLFFGIDPLVTVETKNQERKSAEKGLVGKEQVWTWSWTYNIENKRKNHVLVRIEEPQTQIEDEKMSVTYNDEPKPEQGPEKTFIWNVQVKAEQTSIIKRSITVKAPSDMPINLGR